MSINFSKTNAITHRDNAITLTQYAGTKSMRFEKGKLRTESETRCQVTSGRRYITMSKQQAEQVGLNLLMWAKGMPTKEIDD